MLISQLTRALIRRPLGPRKLLTATALAGRRWQSTDSKVRNIGIIAHIDAGKTTTTERMLYYSGLTNRIGDVDQGDTVMDYLPAERSRGITITAAAITFNWADHKINLIDTPGHADFTFEVLRSIRVLDGAVTVLDGVAGVEAQTEKVWKQANEMGIPKLVFVNKMDRAGAGFGRAVREVVAKLNTRVAVVNIPYFSNPDSADSQFQGVVDVIDKKVIVWTPESDGKQVTVEEVDPEKHGKLHEECVNARTALIETLCELDEALVEEFLEIDDYMAMPSQSIKRALRSATISRQVTPVLCGASFKNIGVQPLLEAVIDYLPAPFDMPAPRAITKLPSVVVKNKKNNKAISSVSKVLPEESISIDPSNDKYACALAFKVVNDPMKGILVFVRVYSGRLQQGTVLLNTSNGQKERVTKLLQMQADETIEVRSVETGNIGVIVGSKDIKTGDTLVAHSKKKDGAHLLDSREKGLHLHPIAVPPPVFFVAIEPMTLADKRGMELALEILLREDPSLHLSYDYDSDQTLLSGMGELHLEIAKDRLTNDLKAKVEMGKIMISYKETIMQDTDVVENTSFDETGASATVRVTVEPVPIEGDGLPDQAELLTHDNNYISYPDIGQTHPLFSTQELHNAVRAGSLPALAKSGKQARLPLHSLHINVHSLSVSDDMTNTAVVSTAVRLAAEQALEALSKEAYAIMEPVMNVRVILNEEDIGTVVNDLSGHRRGHIVSLSENESKDEESDDAGFYRDLAESTYVPHDHTLYLSKHDARLTSRQTVVHARVPLPKMVGYLNSLRSMTQGRGTYLMDFYRYDYVQADRVAEVIDSI